MRSLTKASGIVAVVLAALIGFLTRERVLDCYSQGYCLVMNRWTGKIEIRQGKTANQRAVETRNRNKRTENPSVVERLRARAGADSVQPNTVSEQAVFDVDSFLKVTEEQ